MRDGFLSAMGQEDGKDRKSEVKNEGKKTKILFVLLLAGELFCFATGCVWLMKSGKSVQADAGQLEVGQIERGAEKGNQVGTAVGFDGQERYVGIHPNSFSFGVYKAEVSYRITEDSAENGSSVYVKAYDRSGLIAGHRPRYTIDCGRQDLPSYRNNLSFRFYVRQKRVPVAVSCFLADDFNGLLRVDRIRITFLPAQTVFVFFCTLGIWIIPVNLILYLYLWKREQTREFLQRRGTVLAVLSGIVLVAQFPLLVDGVPQGWDLSFHAYRLQELAQSLRDGAFPVRMQGSWMNGYGYPVSILYGDILLYPFALLYLAGFPLHLCWKILVFAANASTAAIAYGVFSRMAGKSGSGQPTVTQEEAMQAPVRQMAALAATALYTLNPYRLTDLYNRAAAGEFIAMIFLPLVLYGFWKIYNGDRGVLPLSIGMSLILTAHLLSAILTAFFLVVAAVVFWRRTCKKKTLCGLLSSALLTLLFSAFFLIPFLQYYKQTQLLVQTAETNLENASVYLPLVFGTVYKTRGASPSEGEMGGMALSLGFAAGVVLLLSFILLFRQKKKEVLSLVFFSLLAIWMSSNLFPYRMILSHTGVLGRVLSSIQFAWRFLMMAAVFVSALCALVLSEGGVQPCESGFQRISEENKNLLLSVLLLVLIVYQGVSFSGAFLLEEPGRKNETLTCMTDPFQQAGGEYLLSGTDVEACRDRKILTSDASCKAKLLEERGTGLLFSVQNRSNQEETLTLPKFAYPGYRLRPPFSKAGVANRGTVEMAPAGENNRIRITVSPGAEGTWRLCFQEPLSWRIGEVLSLLTAVAVFVRSRRRTKSG